MSGKFVRASSMSISLGTGVNFNGSLDTGSAWAWFMPINALADARIFNKSDGTSDASQTIQLAITGGGGGSVKGILGGIALSSSVTMLLDIWHLLVITYDGTNIRLYFDGVEVASTAKTGNLTSNVEPARIASTGQDTTLRAFDGRIADVGVTDTGLLAGVISSMMQARGAFRGFGDIRHRWLINDREPGVVIGASAVHDIGPQALAPGSGTNSPTFENHDLSFVQLVA